MAKQGLDLELNENGPTSSLILTLFALNNRPDEVDSNVTTTFDPVNKAKHASIKRVSKPASSARLPA